jgi:hypothetical protein
MGLALCAISASALTMAAVLPIAAFWTYSFQDGDRTGVTLAHAGAFLLSGIVGTRFGLEMARALLPPRPARAVGAWLWLYGLVAQQMAWIFRPHFHATDTFMRPLASGGSALESLYRLIVEQLR